MSNRAVSCQSQVRAAALLNIHIGGGIMLRVGGKKNARGKLRLSSNTLARRAACAWTGRLILLPRLVDAGIQPDAEYRFTISYAHLLLGDGDRKEGLHYRWEVRKSKVTFSGSTAWRAGGTALATSASPSPHNAAAPGDHRRRAAGHSRHTRREKVKPYLSINDDNLSGGLDKS